MIEFKNGVLTLNCDTCPEADEFEGESFGLALACAKDFGWRVLKDKDEYIHFCPSCVDAYRKGK